MYLRTISRIALLTDLIQASDAQPPWAVDYGGKYWTGFQKWSCDLCRQNYIWESMDIFDLLRPVLKSADVPDYAGEFLAVLRPHERVAKLEAVESRAGEILQVFREKLKTPGIRHA